MRNWIGTAALAIALAAPAWADEVVKRGGSSGGGSSPESRQPSAHSGSSSSSSGSSHSSPGASSSGSTYSGGSSSSSSGSGSSSWDRPSRTPSRSGGSSAESRFPSPGSGHGSRGHNVPNYRAYPNTYYHNYYYYDPYWSWDYPHGSWGWGFPYYYRSHAPRYGYGITIGRRYDYGALRLLVEPEEASVFVDGNFAGHVDDFDGIFQRLNLRTGRHEITFKCPGYKTHRIRVYVPIDHTVKVHYHMVRGVGEDAAATIGARDDVEEDEESVDTEEAEQPDADEPAQVELTVRPADASVYVDGEFQGAARGKVSLELAPGTHKIEVVRPGFKTYERSLTVKPGAELDLEIELEKTMQL
ncbi:MAG: PEGA domain-containing protein [Vicinamibacteria bacterium]|jgi:hypothetical protein|nr:PEGA domain-containing protein [Vicinamibacteria bacterium]